MRRRIDMTEVEAATKIRAKYLRALENEEWDLLPGPTFVKTFLRTYAEYLELDPRLLVEEYRQRYERPSSQDLTPFGPGLRRPAPAPAAAAAQLGPGDRRAGRRRRPAGRALRALARWGDDDDEPTTPVADADAHADAPRRSQAKPREEASAGRRRRRASRCG